MMYWQIPMIDSGRSYEGLVAAVRDIGQTVPSRYGATKEVHALTVVASPVWMPLRQKYSRTLLVAEALQIIAGTYDAPALRRSAPRARLELFTLSGAYGPRLRSQIPVAIDRLLGDPTSRQVVLFIGSPSDGMSSELPCTMALHYMIRGGRLHCFAHMRSWDLIKGLAYDVPCFGMLTQAIAACVGAQAYSVTVTADSAHVYEGDEFTGKNGYVTVKLTPTFRSWVEWQNWAGHSLVTMPEMPDGVEFVG